MGYLSSVLRLPQKNNHYCYARCSDANEFWVALIEKAYAKLHGSYEGIEGGMPIEAMVDLTGGLAERYELKDKQMHKTLYKYLRKSFASQVDTYYEYYIFTASTQLILLFVSSRRSSPAPGKETGGAPGRQTRMV